MIVITGGGTGGHLAIARALGEELKKRANACEKSKKSKNSYDNSRNFNAEKAVYIGSLYGQDQMWFKDSAEEFVDSVESSAIFASTTESSVLDSSTLDSGADSSVCANTNDTKRDDKLFSACYFLDTTGVVNKKGLRKLQAIFAQLKALWCVRKIFTRHKVRAVISVGGFSAGPASLAAILLRKPLFIHEQNAIKGTLNALLSPFAKCVFSSFAPPYTPYPIKQEALHKRRIHTQCRRIIFIGGSQGARAINNLALQVAPTLLQQGIAITHQCGEKELERVDRAYRELGIRESITLFGFDRDLIAHLDKADICVGRAGASSIWENAALALPTCYIPYPYAAKNHQCYNAQYFVEKGLGAMVLESQLENEHNDAFFHALSALQENLESISQGLGELVTENGASSIITQVLETITPHTSRS